MNVILNYYLSPTVFKELIPSCINFFAIFRGLIGMNMVEYRGPNGDIVDGEDYETKKGNNSITSGDNN